MDYELIDNSQPETQTVPANFGPQEPGLILCPDYDATNLNISSDYSNSSDYSPDISLDEMMCNTENPKAETQCPPTLQEKYEAEGLICSKYIIYFIIHIQYMIYCIWLIKYKF